MASVLTSQLNLYTTCYKVTRFFGTQQTLQTAQIYPETFSNIQL